MCVPPEALGRAGSLPLRVSGGCWHPVACDGAAPILTASIFKCLTANLLLCLSGLPLPPSYKDTCDAFWAHPDHPGYNLPILNSSISSTKTPPSHFLPYKVTCLASQDEDVGIFWEPLSSLPQGPVVFFFYTSHLISQQIMLTQLSKYIKN